VVDAALALTLADDFDPRESIRIAWNALRLPSTAEQAYAFVTKNMDALLARLPRDSGASFPFFGSSLCDDKRRPEVEAFFKDRAAKYTGGPRQLAQALEDMHLCSTFRAEQTPKVTAWFAKR
jgi:alanyl aminopeptidase